MVGIVVEEIAEVVIMAAAAAAAVVAAVVCLKFISLCVKVLCSYSHFCRIFFSKIFQTFSIFFGHIWTCLDVFEPVKAKNT